MNEIKITETVNYFADQINRCKALAKELESDHRADEAVFAKIQMNVYDIFRTVFSAGQKKVGEDERMLVAFFLTRLQEISQSWHTALMAARQHDETEKAYIETIKLETAAEIKTKFNQIWG